MRHKAEMVNIARGEAECYISIEAECRVLYFLYRLFLINLIELLLRLN